MTPAPAPARRRPARAFTPRVESLEDRNLMAAGPVAFSGGLLVINGTSGSDRIIVRDDGTSNANNVTVTFHKKLFLPGIAINRIVINPSAGNDRITYALNGNLLTGVSRTVHALLGPGIDTFKANLFGNLQARASLALEVVGGAGPDFVGVTASNDISIGTGASLIANVRAGTGILTSSINYQGQLSGIIAALVQGGPHNDVVGESFTLNSGSSGGVSSQIYGAAGDDNMTMQLHRVSLFDRATENTFVDGGPGFDQTTATADIVVVRSTRKTTL